MTLGRKVKAVALVWTLLAVPTFVLMALDLPSVAWAVGMLVGWLVFSIVIVTVASRSKLTR